MERRRVDCATPSLGEVSDRFEDVVLVCGNAAWASSRRFRQQQFHGATRCVQRRPPPFGDGASIEIASLEIACEFCTDYFVRLLIEMDKWVMRNHPTTPAAAAIEALQRRVVSPRSIDQLAVNALRFYSGDRGLYQNLNQLRWTRWFNDALPDPDDQEVALLVLQYVRTNDAPSSHSEIAFERLGARLGLPESACARSWQRAEANLRSARPGWMQVNFDREMARRRDLGLVSTEVELASFDGDDDSSWDLDLHEFAVSASGS